MDKTSSRFSSPALTVSDSPIDTCKTIRRSSSMPAPLPRDGQVKQCKAAFRTAAKNVIKPVDKSIAPKSTSPNLLMKLPVELWMKVWRFYLVISDRSKTSTFSHCRISYPVYSCYWGILFRRLDRSCGVTMPSSFTLLISFHLSAYLYALEPPYLWLPSPTALPWWSTLRPRTTKRRIFSQIRPWT